VEAPRERGGGGAVLVAAVVSLLFGCGASPPHRYGGDRFEGPYDARNAYAPIVAMLAPGYSLRVSAGAGGELGEDAEHGVVWTVPVWFREPAWRHGAALSVAQYPATGRKVGRVVYRLRAWSPDVEGPIVHLLFGAGGFWDLDGGPGPRAEVGWLLGRFGRGGAMLGLGWEYAVRGDGPAGDLSLTFFVPYVVR
jgi:hypothetical protein